MRLEELTPGTHVSGVLPSEPVNVVAVTWVGGNGIELFFKRADGQTGSRMLFRADEPALRIESASRAYAFDADPSSFKLAAEAHRIRMAGLFDPMVAVTSSDVEPLPHQLRAVYGELLPRTPLRFLLADDPGAGKTIMAGLYIKELMLRADLERCLVVAPGGLVEQWQDELFQKFGIRFDLLTNDMISADITGDLFTRHPRLIARMDQMARREDLQRALERADFDLVVVDEAHRMSAHYFGPELKTTRRYQLGQLLGRRTRHLLLMTATPHAGKEEDFQLFLALLDADRFEGQFRRGVHLTDTSGLMLRRVKEDLLTFSGKPLFPERRAYTVKYELSPLEQDLYESVTQYVREEMNRAERLKAAGEGRRGNTVGFALTVLQRRLASSPEAIWRSLERRRKRLEVRHQELTRLGDASPSMVEQRLADLLTEQLAEQQDLDDDELTAAEREQAEEQVIDAATAAQTAAELEHEIKVLAQLEATAKKVRYSGTDVKWSQLAELLQENRQVRDPSGGVRKIIVFTEHRDTLDYLVGRVSALLGQPEAVVSIHGGVTREERRARTERFTHGDDCRVMVATDAAGEGLNLQAAHLMVNYDLPWNPNRIEQRFGRIHRIGQTEVCHLWNLVATDTREGQVFARLLDKIEEQRRAYGGKIFDVIGDAFTEAPLRDLLLEAVRYGDQPDVRARLDQVIDASVGEGVDQLLAERALHQDVLRESDVAEVRLRMEEARGRRLSPFYVEAFFRAAFEELGGRISRREPGRYQITRVPRDVLDHDRRIGTGAPVLEAYERVCFDREHLRVDGGRAAALLAPGHPLLDAVVTLTAQNHRGLLKQGAILVDQNNEGRTPRLLLAVTEEISDSHEPPNTLSKRFSHVEVTPDGRAAAAGPAPYLDYDPLPPADREHIQELLDADWLSEGPDQIALAWSVEHGLAAHVAETRELVEQQVNRIRTQVRQRLLLEINNWDTIHGKLLEDEAAGKKLRMRPETAHRRARELEQRLKHRLQQLELDESLQVRPPVVSGAALVLPYRLVAELAGREPGPPAHTRDTTVVERRAVDAALAAERSLGRLPEEMPHNNPGYDIRSHTVDDQWVFLEVKGRLKGAEDFVVTRNEALQGRNYGDAFRLVLVSVDADDPSGDEIRYVTNPFDGFDFGAFNGTRVQGNWEAEWARGTEPV